MKSTVLTLIALIGIAFCIGAPRGIEDTHSPEVHTKKNERICDDCRANDFQNYVACWEPDEKGKKCDFCDPKKCCRKDDCCCRHRKEDCKKKCANPG